MWRELLFVVEVVAYANGDEGIQDTPTKKKTRYFLGVPFNVPYDNGIRRPQGGGKHNLLLPLPPFIQNTYKDKHVTQRKQGRQRQREICLSLPLRDPALPVPLLPTGSITSNLLMTMPFLGASRKLRLRDEPKEQLPRKRLFTRYWSFNYLLKTRDKSVEGERQHGDKKFIEQNMIQR